MIDDVVAGIGVVGFFAYIYGVAKLHVGVGAFVAGMVLAEKNWISLGLKRALVWYVGTGLVMLMLLAPDALQELANGGGGLYPWTVRYDFLYELAAVLGVALAVGYRWSQFSRTRS